MIPIGNYISMRDGIWTIDGNASMYLWQIVSQPSWNVAIVFLYRWVFNLLELFLETGLCTVIGWALTCFSNFRFVFSRCDIINFGNENDAVLRRRFRSRSAREHVKYNKTTWAGLKGRSQRGLDFRSIFDARNFISGKLVKFAAPSIWSRMNGFESRWNCFESAKAKWWICNRGTCYEGAVCFLQDFFFLLRASCGGRRHLFSNSPTCTIDCEGMCSFSMRTSMLSSCIRSVIGPSLSPSAAQGDTACDSQILSSRNNSKSETVGCHKICRQTAPYRGPFFDAAFGNAFDIFIAKVTRHSSSRNVERIWSL